MTKKERIPAMNYTDCSLKEFIERLGSGDPTPGGGGASAMAGALGIALGSMVAHLTVGRKKYADVWDEMQSVIDEAKVLQAELLELINKDAEMFEPLSKAYSLPKTTPEEIETREAVMKTVLIDACLVPLEIMRKCCRCLELIETVSVKGSVAAISDAGDAAAFCKASLQGAALNVFINTKLMKDREKAAEFDSMADTMLETYLQKADHIYDTVCAKLRQR